MPVSPQLRIQFTPAVTGHSASTRAQFLAPAGKLHLTLPEHPSSILV